VTGSPLDLTYSFTVPPFSVSWVVVTTWGILLVLGAGSYLLTRRLAIRPGKTQAFLEMIVGAIDDQIRATIPGDPGRYRDLIGTLLLFILAANWSSVIPGVEPPTAHLETDAALALCVFLATIGYSIRAQGLLGYMRGVQRPLPGHRMRLRPFRACHPLARRGRKRQGQGDLHKRCSACRDAEEQGKTPRADQGERALTTARSDSGPG
jgi:F0F1-type ATP synthase membrane subunit a